IFSPLLSSLFLFFSLPSFSSSLFPRSPLPSTSLLFLSVLFEGKTTPVLHTRLHTDSPLTFSYTRKCALTHTDTHTDTHARTHTHTVTQTHAVTHSHTLSLF